MKSINDLLDIMSALRDPEKGCPWDLEQSFETIVSHTLEEAYEVADTIEREDWQHLRAELGDLLFQVVFYAQLGREAGLFDFQDITDAIAEKLIRRHPHVFGDEKIESAEQQTIAWERHKAQERQGQGGLLHDIPIGLPALTRATKLQKRAATVGFDWEEIAPVLDKVDEELLELRQAIKQQQGMARIQDELGDLLFVSVNLARHAGVNPETALRQTNQKFEQRFSYIETQLASQGKTLEDASLTEMDELWEQAKKMGAEGSAPKKGL